MPLRKVTSLRPASAGARDHACVLEHMVTTTGDSGFPIQTWQALINPYWCARSDVAGDERLTADQVTAPIRVLWSGAYRPEIDPETVNVAETLRIRYLNRTYDILSGFIIGARVGIEFLTLAKV